MPLMSDKIKMISCSDFRLFLKRLIKDKIEKEWSEDYVNDLNLVIFPRSTIKRRYENKGIDLIKLINSPSYYKHVKTNINSNGSLEFEKQQRQINFASENKKFSIFNHQNLKRSNL